MMFTLPSLIKLKPDEIFKLDIPYISTRNDVERLKRILYAALSFLSKRSEEEILAALQDAINLYFWFFDMHLKETRQTVENQFKSENLDILSYVDIETYLEDLAETLKLHYLSEVDVLNTLLKMPTINSLNAISIVKTDFSDTEFFCVLALDQASIAIKALEETKKLLNKQQKNINEAIIDTIKTAGNAILEAQVAIDYAESYQKSGTSQVTIDFYVKDFHKNVIKLAHTTRYGDKHKKRREKAWELFSKERSKYKSDYETIESIVIEIQLYSDELGINRLKDGSEVDTIYRMILQIRKQNNHQNNEIS